MPRSYLFSCVAVLLLLLQGVARSEPAESLSGLKPREAYSRMKHYLGSAKPEELAPLQELIYVDASKLFFHKGAPLWLYQPRKRKELSPTEQKAIEDGLRTLLVNGLTGEGGLLVAAAADELRRQAKFRVWYPAQSLAALDDQLALDWVKWYLEEAGPPVRGSLEDLIDLTKSKLTFTAGVPTWSYWPRNPERLAANRRTITDRLIAVLVQALGNYREGLLETAAMEELKVKLRDKDRLVSAVAGGGTGGAPGEDRFALLEKKISELRGDVKKAAQAVQGLQSGVAKVKVLEKDLTELQKDVKRLKHQSRPASARLIVRLPNDAQLFVHGIFCPLTSQTRSFDTPELPPGRRYYYNLTVQLVRGGRVVRESRQVFFEAGQEVRVDFSQLGASTVRR